MSVVLHGESFRKGNKIVFDIGPRLPAVGRIISIKDFMEIQDLTHNVKKFAKIVRDREGHVVRLVIRTLRAGGVAGEEPVRMRKLCLFERLKSSVWNYQLRF